jgi:hypothetical protein
MTPPADHAARDRDDPARRATHRTRPAPRSSSLLSEHLAGFLSHHGHVGPGYLANALVDEVAFAAACRPNLAGGTARPASRYQPRSVTVWAAIGICPPAVPEMPAKRSRKVSGLPHRFARHPARRLFAVAWRQTSWTVATQIVRFRAGGYAVKGRRCRPSPGYRLRRRPGCPGLGWCGAPARGKPAGRAGWERPARPRPSSGMPRERRQGRYRARW